MTHTIHDNEGTQIGTISHIDGKVHVKFIDYTWVYPTLNEVLEFIESEFCTVKPIITN